MKRIIQNIVLLALTALLLAGIFWARSKAADETCTQVKVQILNRDSTVFVTEQGVMDDLARRGFKVIGKPMWQIDASRIEESLKRSEYLENVECVKAHDGVLIIRASQLVPVLRVFEGHDVSYYVNAAGKRMTATANYHTDVPVVQGTFSKQFPATRILPLVSYVEGDTLLRSLVSMYSVRDSDNIFIIPSIYGHVVNMGGIDGYVSKLEKLKLFYRKVMPAKGWETYDTISVKWNHQVVATRRQKAVQVAMTYDPDDDEVIPDMETMGVDDNNATLAVDKKKREEAKKKTETPKKQPADKRKDHPADQKTSAKTPAVQKTVGEKKKTEPATGSRKADDNQKKETTKKK